MDTLDALDTLPISVRTFHQTSDPQKVELEISKKTCFFLLARFAPRFLHDLVASRGAIFEAFHDLAEWTDELILLIVKCADSVGAVFVMSSGPEALGSSRPANFMVVLPLCPFFGGQKEYS